MRHDDDKYAINMTWYAFVVPSRPLCQQQQLVRVIRSGILCVHSIS